MTTRTRAAQTRTNLITTSSTTTPKRATQRAYTSATSTKDQPSVFTIEPSGYIQSTDRFSVDDEPTSSSARINISRGRTTTTAATSNSSLTNHNSTRGGSRTRNRLFDYDEEDEIVESGSEISEDFSETDDYTTQTATQRGGQYTTPAANRQAAQKNLNSTSPYQHNYTHHTLLSPLHTGIYQHDKNAHSQTSRQSTLPSSTTTASTTTRSPIHTKINSIATPHRPSSASHSTHQQQHQQQSQSTNHQSQHPSAPSSSQKPPQSSRQSDFPWVESITKSYNNPLIKPLYYIITFLSLLILLLLFILTTNRAILTIPLLSPQQVLPTDPILLTNGHYLTQKDLIQLSNHFSTLGTIQKLQNEQKEEYSTLSTTFTSSLRDVEKHLNGTIDALQAKLGSQRNDLGDKMTKLDQNVQQLQKAQATQQSDATSLSTKLKSLDDYSRQSLEQVKNSKVDVVNWNADKQEISFELLAINQLIDALEQTDITLSSRITSMEGIVKELQQIKQSLVDRDGKVIPSHKAHKNDILAIIDDVLFNTHIKTIINHNISTLQSELEKINTIISSAQSTIGFEQYSKLSNDMREMSLKLGKLEDSFDTITASSLETKLTQLQTSIATLSTDHTQLADQLHEIELKLSTFQQQGSTSPQISTELIKTLSTTFMPRNEVIYHINHHINADHTGMVDFAHLSLGSSVISHSPQYTPAMINMNTHIGTSNIPLVSLLQTTSLFGSVDSTAQQPCPSTILTEIKGLGDCLTVSGRTGFILIDLGQLLYVSHITIEHISPQINPFSTAMPRHIAFYGINIAGNVGNEDLLLENQYQHPVEPATSSTSSLTDVESVPTVQTFQVTNEIAKSKPYQRIKVDIKSNYGNIEFTQLYRIRVHGKPVQK